MASKAVKALNKAHKGTTGPLTVRQRKKRGMKARPNASSTKSLRQKAGGRKK